MIRFTKDNLPDDGWGTYRKKTTTKATYIPEGFVVQTAEGEVRLPEGGWLAVDSRGYPYPIADDEFQTIYEEVD